MSIRIPRPRSHSCVLQRDVRLVVARSFGLAIAAAPVPVLGGAVGMVPALTGLLLFCGLLIALERGIAAHHPHPRLGAANQITLTRAAIVCFIAARAIDPDPLAVADRWLLSVIAASGLV